MLDHASWPPDYVAVYAWRARQLERLRNSPVLRASAWNFYSKPENAALFICHWLDTYNPRKAKDRWMPFVLFKRQEELVRAINECVADQEELIVEKCRDAGVTWIACAVSVWRWIFVKDDAIGWGSRKAMLVDKSGEPDSIFEKMRMLIRRLPDIWMPKGFSWKVHSTEGKLVNPVNNSVISGEAGDNIGRGGRKSLYWVDESAHLSQPEKVEAALGDNTNVKIHISSVNGLGNVFWRKRQGGQEWGPDVEFEPQRTRVFVFDWRHHPEKTQEWYDLRKAKAEREGLQALFAQEVDRDYSAAISNTAIPREWVMAAVDAHKTWDKYEPPNAWMAGLDVADGGVDRNGLSLRQGVILRHAQEWGERDPGVTTRRTIQLLANYGEIDIQYDCIGVGAAVKSEYNRLLETEDPPRCRFIPWNAGAKVHNGAYRVIPDDDQSPMNKDFFGNFKAQAWWAVRTRFYKTWRMRAGEAVYPPEELISIDSRIELLHQLIDEIAQPTIGQASDLRMIINKRPDGMKSPNLADATIQAYFPAPADGGHFVVGSYSG